MEEGEGVVRSGKLMISEEGRLVERGEDEENCRPVEGVVFVAIVAIVAIVVGGGGICEDDCVTISIGISGIADNVVVDVIVDVGNDDGMTFGDEVGTVDEEVKTPRNRSSWEINFCST